MQLSIIIVNYNVKYFLEQCLFSVIKACRNIESEIFVVDNNSTDGSREYLGHKFPSVIFKWNNNNQGFAKACNSVLGEANGKLILFLNPDTIVAEDTFEKCIRFLNNNREYGALGVRMIDGTGAFLKESKRSFPSPSTAFFKMAGLATLFPRSKLFAKYYATDVHEHTSHRVDVLAGAYMMLTEKAIHSVKGFDEDFFMYGEDIDLSFRVQNAGLKNYYFAGTSIIHFKGESTLKNSRSYIHNFFDSMKLFVTKHYSERRATGFILKKAISLGKLLASLRSHKGKAGPPISGQTKNTIVISSQSHFNELIHLLKHASQTVTLAGRVAVNETDNESSIGNLSSLKEIVIQHRVGQVVFCEGEISFKEIIKYSQLLKDTRFLFHARGSNSIVGSNNKNENGIFIAIPTTG
ncbi:MAG TPA: glycosyltransferase family 2 protein [Ferruginibacter sp.]|nr:glycosyltransferase family 2 protein [Ferruginibacter sp.]